jgi:hypothetical protein
MGLMGKFPTPLSLNNKDCHMLTSLASPLCSSYSGLGLDFLWFVFPCAPGPLHVLFLLGREPVSKEFLFIL